MKKKISNMIAAAVFVMPLFVVSGCSSERLVYTSGFVTEAEQKCAETERSSALSDTQKTQKTDSDAADSYTARQGASEDFGEAQTETFATCGYVYICGEITVPGVYPIYEDMRLISIVEEAGGFTENADSQWLNLAEVLQDGQRICIYSQEETAQFRANGSSPSDFSLTQKPDTGAAGSENTKMNINTADKQMLMTLPGIGEAKAEAIISYRTQKGGFTSVEEIQNISGIKNAVFSRIQDLITV